MQLDTLQFELVHWCKLSIIANSNTAAPARRLLHLSRLLPSPLSFSRVGWPLLGLGTYRLRGSECYNSAGAALALVYRRIDTASFDRNEAQVGQAIAASGLDPTLLHVTSKVGPHDVDSEESALASVRRLLARLSSRLSIPTCCTDRTAAACSRPTRVMRRIGWLRGAG